MRTGQEPGHFGARALHPDQQIGFPPDCAFQVIIVATSSGVAKAYQCAPPAIIATFDYSYLVFAAFWSMAFFSEPPDAATIAGMLAITGAGLFMVARSNTRSPSTAAGNA